MEDPFQLEIKEDDKQSEENAATTSRKRPIEEPVEERLPKQATWVSSRATEGQEVDVSPAKDQYNAFGGAQESVFSQFRLGEEGFAIKDLFQGEDIIPLFLFVMTQKRPQVDLKKRIIGTASGFYAVDNLSSQQDLLQELTGLLADPATIQEVDMPILGFILNFGLEVLKIWILPLDPFPEVYSSLGVENSDAQDSHICWATRRAWEALHCGDKKLALHGMALCGDLLLTPDLCLPMGTFDDMAAH